ncbi:MAG: endonuclease/exonuclease/phosphatase family protein, partial [Proteobacteria bacterium]|nr:endonuclease/exonuclease/phosphatase family protein [Pseudomonadota bacterium]
GADVQVLPVWVELRVDGDRYCAAFGGDAVRKDNRPGLTKLRKAPAPAECLDRDLSVASLNVLHGALGCAEGTQCRLVDRLDLLIDWIADSGCADVMTFQEVFILDAPGFVNARTIIEDGVAEVCPWAYESVAIPISVFDDQLILSRDRILESSAISIPTAFRSVTWARVDHPIGPVDVFSTHLASGADNGGEPCNVAGCPQACRDEGLTIRECQARLMAEFIVEKHDVDAPAVATGDFNDEPGTITYLEFTDRGWLDVYLEAGNPECDPDTGVGCTSGREDENLTDLESPAAGVNRRIDYIFLIPPGEGSVCAAEIDGAGDADGDGQFTRHFTDEPNPFDATCGPAPDRPCWPSDHEGVELDLNCAAAGGGD